jgi:hypothetical protein
LAGPAAAFHGRICTVLEVRMRSPKMRVQWVISLVALIVTVTLSAAQTPSPARLLVLLRDASALASSIR